MVLFGAGAAKSGEDQQVLQGGIGNLGTKVRAPPSDKAGSNKLETQGLSAQKLLNRKFSQPVAT